jgi:hypothetical protein
MSSTEILILGIILIAILYFALKYFKLNKIIKKEAYQNKSEQQVTTVTTVKIIKFFGSDHCPYSNKNSPAYKVIQEFEEKNPDIVVEYYWVGSDDNLMKDHNIEYVPAIFNSKYEEIELGLPEGVKPDGKSVDELKKILFDNIKSKL